MNIKIEFFAMAREIAGVQKADLNLPEGTTVSELLKLVVDRYPGLKPWKNYIRIAVNLRYAGDETPVADGDEIAIIPPVSGG